MKMEAVQVMEAQHRVQTRSAFIEPRQEWRSLITGVITVEPAVGSKVNDPVRRKIQAQNLLAVGFSVGHWFPLHSRGNLEASTDSASPPGVAGSREKGSSCPACRSAEPRRIHYSEHR